LDNRVKSIEHQVGVFPWPRSEEEDPDQPDDKLLTIFPPGTGSGEETTAVYQETMMMHTTLTDLSTTVKQMKKN